MFQGLTRGLYQAQDDSDALVGTLEKVVKKQRVRSRQVNIVAFRMIARQNNTKDWSVQQALNYDRVEVDAMLADSVQQVTNEHQFDIDAKQRTIDQKESQLTLCSGALDRSYTVTAQAVRELEKLDLKAGDVLNDQQVEVFGKAVEKTSEAESVMERAYKKLQEVNVLPQRVNTDSGIKSPQGPVEGEAKPRATGAPPTEWTGASSASGKAPPPGYVVQPPLPSTPPPGFNVQQPLPAKKMPAQPGQPAATPQGASGTWLGDGVQKSGTTTKSAPPVLGDPPKAGP